MSVKTQVFKKLRDAHKHEMAEDYVEMIQELVADQGEARLTELAKQFGVSSVTAHKVVSRLQKEGLVESQPYRALFLTSDGEKLATKSRERHEIVYAFLRKLGVSETAAQIDTEGIEHHVSPETLKAFKKFLTKK